MVIVKQLFNMRHINCNLQLKQYEQYQLLWLLFLLQ